MVYNFALCSVCRVQVLWKIFSDLTIISRTSGPFLKLLTPYTPLHYSRAARILPGEATPTAPAPSVVLRLSSPCPERQNTRGTAGCRRIQPGYIAALNKAVEPEAPFHPSMGFIASFRVFISER